MSSPWPIGTLGAYCVSRRLSCGPLISPTPSPCIAWALRFRSAVAVERIYEAKGRDPQKPLPICVADPSDVAQYATVDHLPSGLLEALLPGPVTLVLPYGKPGASKQRAMSPGLTDAACRCLLAVSESSAGSAGSADSGTSFLAHSSIHSRKADAASDA